MHWSRSRRVFRDSRCFLHRSDSPRRSRSSCRRSSAPSSRSTPSSAHASEDRIRQIVTRLMLHFACPAGEKAAKHLRRLHCELLHGSLRTRSCAAYQHVLKNHKYNSLPKIADFLTFMQSRKWPAANILRRKLATYCANKPPEKSMKSALITLLTPNRPNLPRPPEIRPQR